MQRYYRGDPKLHLDELKEWAKKVFAIVLSNIQFSTNFVPSLSRPALRESPLFLRAEHCLHQASHVSLSGALFGSSLRTHVHTCAHTRSQICTTCFIPTRAHLDSIAAEATKGEICDKLIASLPPEPRYVFEHLPCPYGQCPGEFKYDSSISPPCVPLGGPQLVLLPAPGVVAGACVGPLDEWAGAQNNCAAGLVVLLSRWWHICELQLRRP